MDSSIFVDLPSMAIPKGAVFIVGIGGRRIGKTYGILKYWHTQKRMFLFCRRTESEIMSVCNDTKNPFKRYNIDNKTDIQMTYTTALHLGAVHDNIVGTQIGYTGALMSLHHLRGADFSDVTDMYIDEFIPDQYRHKPSLYEGDALLNLYDTVASTREFDGGAPVRLWLTANPINLDNPILDALNIIPQIDSMVRANQRTFYDPERRLFIFNGKGTQEFIEKRKRSAIIKLVGVDSKYYSDAVESKYNTNTFNDIRKIDTKYLLPLAEVSINDYIMYIYVAKQGSPVSGFYYFTRSRCDAPMRYTNNSQYRKDWYYRYAKLKSDGLLYFDSAKTKIMADRLVQ